MLLDIYEEQVVGVHSVGDPITKKDECRICSKEFGFIKRLVENNKLDEEEIQYVGCDDMQIYYKDYERIIMALSISKEPIQFLVSIIK